MSLMSKLAGDSGEWWDVFEAFVDGAYEDWLVTDNGVGVDLIAQFSR